MLTGGYIIIGLIFLVLAGGLGTVAYVIYRRALRRAKGIERGLKMVPLLVHLPPASADTATEGRDVREVMRQKVAQAETLYNLIAGTAKAGFKSRFYGQRHLALEVIATNGKIYFYVAAPVALAEVVKQAIVTAYPGASVEEAEDHNVFSEAGKLPGTAGGELVLKHESAYPIATYKHLEADPLEAIFNGLTTLSSDEGAGVQIMVRPAGEAWTRRAIKTALKLRGKGGAEFKFGAKDFVKAAIKSPTPAPTDDPRPPEPKTGAELAKIEAIEEKTRYTGYETLIRLLVSTPQPARSETLLAQLSNAFALYDAPGLNGFKYVPAKDITGLVTAFIFRFFPPRATSSVLNSAELATIFHLPEAQFTATSQVERQAAKQAEGPPTPAASGLLLGYNVWRGAQKEVRLTPEDRRRHTYIVGQTGTGKSTMLENLAVQDMLEGRGFAFIDPHGDAAERLISVVPKNRAEDVIYFNPADSQTPLGLNLFEFSSPEQKDFIIQETIGMLYKLYDPGHTGIIGPRYEHWYRNAALTLMSDPAGATFIEVPKVFTDTDFLRAKFKHLTDPTVIDFWTKEMAQTSDYHKSEMLGWFVSKFGAFQQNDIMRNILGQVTSAFDVRQAMDEGKILIVNLSKGQLGELNANLLGMMLVIKFQAAAMSRASVAAEARKDFCLYVDEFQNFSTDSFASILSESRKYGLNLIVANQFIGQLNQQVREAVFGNVGSIIGYRVGPEDAEFLVKQFAPVFDQQDLVNLPNFNAVIRLMLNGLPTQPFSLVALPPLGISNPTLGEAVKELSAAKYGHPRAQVEAEILRRISTKPTQPAPQPASAPAPKPQTAPVPPPQPQTAPPPAATQPQMQVTPPAPATPPPVQPPSQPSAGEVTIDAQGNVITT